MGQTLFSTLLHILTSQQRLLLILLRCRCNFRVQVKKDVGNGALANTDWIVDATGGSEFPKEMSVVGKWPEWE